MFETVLTEVDYDLGVEAAVETFLGPVTGPKEDLEKLRALRELRKNKEVTSANFPSTRHGKAGVGIIPYRFNRPVWLLEVLRTFDKDGLRAAELIESLPFGVKQFEKAELWAPPVTSFG